MQGSGTGEGKIVPGIDGAGAYAHVVVAVDALTRGVGNIVRWNARSTIPAEYAPALLEGIDAVIRAGVVAGFELVDVQIAIESGSHHEEDSTRDAFREAAQKALSCALLQAEPLLLEAYSTLQVIVPARLATAVQAVIGAESRQAVQAETQLHAIAAHVATAAVNQLVRKVLVVTSGVGQITCAPGGFRPAPDISDELAASVAVRP